MAPLANEHPLPPNPYSSSTDLHNAYEHTLWLERYEHWSCFVSSELINDYSEHISRKMKPNVAARVLGYGLVYAPNEIGRSALAREVNSCFDTNDEGRNQELLAGLAYLYVYGLIRVFRNPKGPTPSVSSTISPRESVEISARDPHLLKRSSTNVKEIRKQVLQRDNDRCAFSGVIDKSKAEEVVHPDAPFRRTNLAHIISQSLSQNISGFSKEATAKFAWARTAGALLERFGGFFAHEVLDDAVLQSPKNTLTLSLDMHDLFDGLEVWLTPIEGQLDTYSLEHYKGPSFLRQNYTPIRNPVKFQSIEIDGSVIHAPDSKIIAVHAACAQIAYMSGAAEHLDEFYRDLDMIAVMTEPNAAQELSRALTVLQVIPATA